MNSKEENESYDKIFENIGLQKKNIEKYINMYFDETQQKEKQKASD